VIEPMKQPNKSGVATNKLIIFSFIGIAAIAIMARNIWRAFHPDASNPVKDIPGYAAPMIVPRPTQYEKMIAPREIPASDVKIVEQNPPLLPEEKEVSLLPPPMPEKFSQDVNGSRPPRNLEHEY
jgi:hypothetical protein